MIGNILNRLGFRLRRVQKAKPLKKVLETDAIFDNLHKINQESDLREDSLRISIDTKAKRLILGFEDMIKFKLCPLCACPPCAASTTSLMKENVTKKSDGSAGPTACVVRLARPTKSPSAVATTGTKNVADTPARTAENGLTTLPGPFSWGGISPGRCGSLTST